MSLNTARIGAASAVAFGAWLQIPMAKADVADPGRPAVSAETQAGSPGNPARVGRTRAAESKGRADRNRRSPDGLPQTGSPLPQPAAAAGPTLRRSSARPAAATVSAPAGDVTPPVIAAPVAEPAAPAPIAPQPDAFSADIRGWAYTSVGPAPAPAPAITLPKSAIKTAMDTIGTRLAVMPVTLGTDVASAALWALRGALAQAGPMTCALCSGRPAAGANAARVLTVTSRVDGATGSLRDVLGQASSGDVIRFAPRLWGATLALTEGELVVDVSVSIEGTGQTLDAGGQSRIMRLDEPGTSVSLAKLNFVNGRAPGDPATATSGGAIFAQGVALDVRGARFSGNSALGGPADPGAPFAQAALGGAIAAINSTVTVSDSEFRANTVTGADNNVDQQAGAGLGGAIFSQDSTVTLQRSRFIRNTATGGSGVTPIAAFPSSDGGWGAGGAVFSQGGPLSAADVTFRRNSAAGGEGLTPSSPNPYGNQSGGGGNASAGALWVQGRGRDGGDPVILELTQVSFCGNSVTGGTAGAQVTNLNPGQQGGRAVGGALASVDWVDVRLADVTVDHNIAGGGGAGDNAPGSGSNTGTGGVAEGGGLFLESPSSLQATRLSARDNTAQGGRGADSAPDSGTEAGEGGAAYGGGLLVYNDTGSGMQRGVVIPVGVRDSAFVGNRALGGEAGSGPPPASGLGGGGIAQAGGMSLISLFQADLLGVRFVGNSALAGQGKFAQAGGLATPYAGKQAKDGTTLIQNSLFRANTAVGGDDAANSDYRQSQGGGFLNDGLAVVSGSRFCGNTVAGGDDTGSGHVGSGYGGAVYSLGSEPPALEVFNSTFAGNSALGGRRLTQGDSIVEESAGEAEGGGISAEIGTTTVNGGVLVGNRAVVRVEGDFRASGGAISIPDPGMGFINDLSTTGVLSLFNTARSTKGSAEGGAVAFSGTTFVDSGSQITFNTARSGRSGGTAYGGALFLTNSTQLNGTTVSGNKATAQQGYGGGAALPDGPQVLTQVQTTFRGNRASTSGNDLWWPDSP